MSDLNDSIVPIPLVDLMHMINTISIMPYAPADDFQIALTMRTEILPWYISYSWGMNPILASLTNDIHFISHPTIDVSTNG